MILEGGVLRRGHRLLQVTHRRGRELLCPLCLKVDRSHAPWAHACVGSIDRLPHQVKAQELLAGRLQGI